MTDRRPTLAENIVPWLMFGLVAAVLMRRHRAEVLMAGARTCQAGARVLGSNAIRLEAAVRSNVTA